MKKTSKMIEIEKRIGEPIEEFLRREYTEKGKSTIGISNLIGVDNTTLSKYWFKELGIKARSLSEARFSHFKKKVEKPSKEELERLYQDKTSTELGKIFGVDRHTVLSWLKAFNIKIKNWHSARGYSFNKPTKQELEKLYFDEQNSIPEIAQIIGVSRDTVLRWLKENDIELRKIPHLSKEQLHELYVISKKSSGEIAREIGVSSTTIKRWLKEYDIERRNSSDATFARFKKDVERPSSEKLTQLYIVERKSLEEIGKMFNVSRTAVKGWLKESNISIRGARESAFARCGKDVKIPSEEQLHRWYVDEGKSAYAIAKLTETSQRTVMRWLDKAKIKTRTLSEARFSHFGKDITLPTKEQLYTWYVKEKKSTYEIGEIMGVSYSVVVRWLRKNGIKIRDPSESTFARLKKSVFKPTQEQLYSWYVKERRSTPQIAKLSGVSESTVLQWLRNAGVEVRDTWEAQLIRAGKNIEKPTNEQLYKWYVEENKSPEEIAEILGVSATPIVRWLKEAKIPIRSRSAAGFARFGKKVTKPSREMLCNLYVNEKKTIPEIGYIWGVAHGTVSTWLKEANIETREILFGYKERQLCEDGHEVRSGYERRVDNWLYLNGIEHKYDTTLSGKKGFRSDFRVEDIHIEVWGLTGVDFYDNKIDEKIAYYKKHNLKRIDVFPDDFDLKNSFIKKLAPLLKYADFKMIKQTRIGDHSRDWEAK